MTAMARKLFALLRTLVVTPLFILLWLWGLPRWLAGPNVFADPRPLGWIALAVGAVVALPRRRPFPWRGVGPAGPCDPPRQPVVTRPDRYLPHPTGVGLGVA